MYASQTKRLCVRGAPTDDTRVQHHSLSEAKTGTVDQANIVSSLVENQPPLVDKMIASASGTTNPSNRSTIQIPSSNDNTPSTISKVTATPRKSLTSLSQTHQSTKYVDIFQTSILQLLERLDIQNQDDDNAEIILTIRNQITASNKKKDLLIHHPDFMKLVRLMKSDLSYPRLKCQTALLICSLAKCGEHVAQKLIRDSIDVELFKYLTSDNQIVVEASLRCLRAILCWPSCSESWIFYKNPDENGENVGSRDNKENVITVRQMLSLISPDRSIHLRECVADIFSYTCFGQTEQFMLYNAGTLDKIFELLDSPSYRLVIAGLNWLMQICSNNCKIALSVTRNSSYDVYNKLKFLMAKDKSFEMQFLAARCFTHIFRAIGKIEKFDEDQTITRHVLPTLIRMVKEDKPPILRFKSAECIAYLIENDRRLQETASNCDHLIDSLVKMLDYDHLIDFLDKQDVKDSNQNLYNYDDLGDKPFWLNIRTCKPSTLGVSLSKETPMSNSQDNEPFDFDKEVRSAAFLALAALGSSEETIRKKIFTNTSVMHDLVRSLSQSGKVLKSALTCLLSLSRSVQQLRTNFVESSVYNALKNLLATTSDDILILVLAILCNVSVEFSPGKQQFLDSKTISKLVELTHRSDPLLRLHGMWILMNIVYQDRNQSLKFTIINALDLNHVINLIDNETNEDIVLKTLGFLRNVLSQRADIDAIMKSFGERIMQSLIRILEGQDRNSDVKEQTLCVLTNIADGSESKKLLMNSRILNYMARTISDEKSGNLRLAAICCITNLIHKKNDGSYERRTEIRKYGIDEKLKSMLNSQDPSLSDRARTAYNQFVNGFDDK